MDASIGQAAAVFSDDAAEIRAVSHLHPSDLRLASGGTHHHKSNCHGRTAATVVALQAVRSDVKVTPSRDDAPAVVLAVASNLPAARPSPQRVAFPRHLVGPGDARLQAISTVILLI